MPDPYSQNQSASRALDSIARGARRVTPIESGPRPPRIPLWPAVPWQFHLAFIVISGIALWAAFSNSFGPGDDRAADKNWTLDNKYIIELDPRTKANAKLFDISNWSDNTVRASFYDIWTKD